MQIRACAPTTIPVMLVGDNFKVEVVVFDVKQMLMFHFDNTELNQIDNLAVILSDRFARYDPPNDKYGEINSDTWYNTAYNNCNGNPSTDFYAPCF